MPGLAPGIFISAALPRDKALRTCEQNFANDRDNSGD
jgi:hypothetical protein